MLLDIQSLNMQLPLVLSRQKNLSKRHAATSLEEYKDEGYLDSAILNTLASWLV